MIEILHVCPDYEIASITAYRHSNANIFVVWTSLNHNIVTGVSVLLNVCMFTKARLGRVVKD